MQAESDGRPGARLDIYGESQPFGEFVRTILRYSPLIVVLVAVCAAGTYVLTTPQPPQPIASSQIGLTQQVVWPFFDTARQRAVSTIESEDFETELIGQVARGPLSVSVEAPAAQAFLIIEVEAETAEAAAIGADLAAELLLERDVERLAESADAELARTSQLLAASQQRVAEIEAQLAALVPAEAEAGAAVGLAPTSTAARETLLAAQLERASLSQALNEELRLQVGTQVAVDEAQAAVATIVPELEILRVAGPADVTPERSFIPVAAAAALAAVAGLGLAVLFDRARGRIATTWHAEQVAGVPVLADMAPRRSRERAAALFMTSLVNTNPDGTDAIAFVGLKGAQTARWLAMITQYLQLAGIRVLVVTPTQDDLPLYGDGTAVDWREVQGATDRRAAFAGVSTIVLPPNVMLLDTAVIKPVLHDIADQYDIVLVEGGVMGGREADLAIALADLAVFVARKNVNRVDQLRRAARIVRGRNLRVLGVVLRPARLLPRQKRLELPEQPDRYERLDVEGVDPPERVEEERRAALWN